MSGSRAWSVRIAVDAGLLGVLIAFALVAGELEGSGPWTRAQFVALAVPMLVVAVLLARRWPVVAAILPGALSLVASGNLFTSQLVVAQLAFAFLLGRRTDGRRALLGLGITVAGLLAVFVLVIVTGGAPGSADDWFEMLTGLVLQVLIPWAAGQYMYQHGELVRAGWDLAERLEREQDRAVGQARMRERARIAGDMHDSLGHDLSLVAVQAGALEAIASDPGQRAAAARLRESAAAVTERLHEVVTMLRDDADTATREAPPAAAVRPDDAIAALVERAAASGMRVTLDSGPEQMDGIARDTVRAAHRVVQEALTNAAKHAPGAEVRVTLANEDTADATLVVTVTNDTSPRPPGGIGTGYGLIGLDERVRLAGGVLTAGTEPGGGFVVTARLPVRRAHARATNVHSADAEATGLPGTMHAVQPAHPEGTAHAELAAARARLRRGMLITFWTPALAGVALVAAFLLGGGRI
ncbi:ATP-binding protein [Promicromonospora sp. MEB111]|uniref:ATP-binding protein n=1 Tax=Promicromonospora sp. MEB111 TaxID=3040301 RepID=UPI00254A1D3F|nr:ATP-binding protein [Promicromonospora sp. MEB111]